jgi:hypothetical protein
MKHSDRHHRVAVAVAALLAGGLAFAQPSLTQPNNSAGSVMDTPPQLQLPAAATTLRETPSRTENSITAFEKLDSSHRGYVTQSDVSRLPGMLNFPEADLNHDGRLDINEFQRFWGDYQSFGAQ